MTNILIADDEQPLANFLSRGLKAEGHHCHCVHQLHELVPFLRQHSPEILILDRMFGDEDSLFMIENIKSLPNAPMILMLTALDEVTDRVAGLKAGADDYLCKPFDFEELLARIIALVRLQLQGESSEQSDRIEVANLTINRQERIALLFNKELKLTRIEYMLLLYLVENKGRVVTRERILSRVWNTSEDPHTNVVDVYISRLRKKIEDDTALQIVTLRGNGYRLKVMD